jgi:charged multivesicular body protein 1
MQREAKSCEKREAEEKKKAAAALKKNQPDIARVYASNAIREKNQRVSMIKLASRMDAVAARVEIAVKMNKVRRAAAGRGGGGVQRASSNLIAPARS